MPEMPEERRARYTTQYDLPEYDAMVLTLQREMSDFFDQTVAAGADPKQASNWLMGEVSAYLNAKQKALAETGLTPANLSQMIQLIDHGTISSKIAKQLFQILADQGGDAQKIVEEKGMAQISDPEVLRPMIAEIIEGDPKTVEDYKNGKDRAVGYFVGQVMKQSRGKANPQVVNQLIMEKLKTM